MLALHGAAWAITWGDSEHTCPVCSTKNTFQTPMSYGSYIYSYPSKYQMIYWPYTDRPTVYCCSKCRLSTYMYDFDSIPAANIPALRTMLADVKIAATDDYTEIPVSTRLEIAERVYTILGRDQDFWGHFYRVLGYHYHHESLQEKADAARRRALSIAESQLTDTASLQPRKISYYIIGAMQHFLRNDEQALASFDKTVSTPYVDRESTAEESGRAEEGITKLTNEYIDLIRTGKYPRDHRKMGDADHHH